MADSTDGIGARLLELRTWRRMSLRATAELAGCSASFLSRAERGLTTVDSRALIDGFAYALRVAPSDILGVELPGRDPISATAHKGVERISDVLTHNRLGQPYRDEPCPWSEVKTDLCLLKGGLHASCDHIQQAEMLPNLIERLFTAHANFPAHRHEVLVGLICALWQASTLGKNLGANGIPPIAAMHMRYVADELDDPAWVGFAEWGVGQASGDDRSRMLAVSRRAAEQLEGTSDLRARQVRGMLHLNAAMASAALRRADDARAHLAEAWDMACATEGAADFGNLHFGAPNWTAWRIAIGVELGEGPKVAELARGFDMSTLPWASRRCMFYGDVARGLAQDRRTRPRAVTMMRAAEDTAPQRIRTDPYMKETVRGLMRQAKRDAVGRELRGLAWRMGLAV